MKRRSECGLPFRQKLQVICDKPDSTDEEDNPRSPSPVTEFDHATEFPVTPSYPSPSSFDLLSSPPSSPPSPREVRTPSVPTISKPLVMYSDSESDNENPSSPPPVIKPIRLLSESEDENEDATKVRMESKSSPPSPPPVIKPILLLSESEDENEDATKVRMETKSSPPSPPPVIKPILVSSESEDENTDTDNKNNDHVAYYRNTNMPIAWANHDPLDIYTILNFLLVPPPKLICKDVPHFVNENAAFVVPNSLFGCPEDVFSSHEIGAWESHGGGQRYYEVKIENGKLTSYKEVVAEYDEKTKKIISASANVGTRKTGSLKRPVDVKNVIRLSKRYSRLKSETAYRRSVYMATDYKGTQLTNNIVHYYFIGGVKRDIVMTSHGNSKIKTALYSQTSKSTRKNVQDELKMNKPRSVYNVNKPSTENYKISNEVRSLQQLYDINRANKVKSDDIIFDVLLQQKTGEKDESQFVQETRLCEYPAGINFFDQHLIDIEWFCCQSERWGILSVDPTFNIGDFYVTPIAYPNLSVLRNKTGKHPTFVGPMLVHHKKDFETYHFLASKIVAKRPGIKSVIALGTDGETALVNAFVCELHESVLHLLCTIHCKNNVEDELRRNLKYPDDVVKQIVGTIFGEDGIIESEDRKDFQTRVDSMKEVWGKLEDDIGKERQFYDWFMKNKFEDMVSCMIRLAMVSNDGIRSIFWESLNVISMWNYFF